METTISDQPEHTGVLGGTGISRSANGNYVARSSGRRGRVHLGTFPTRRAAAHAVQQHRRSECPESTTTTTESPSEIAIKVDLAAQQAVSAIFKCKCECRSGKVKRGVDGEQPTPSGIDVHCGGKLRARFKGKHLGYYRSAHEAQNALKRAEATYEAQNALKKAEATHPGKLIATRATAHSAQQDELGLHLSPHSATGYCGVIKRSDRLRERFVAKFKGKIVGTFDTAVQAAHAFAKAASLYNENRGIGC